MNLSRNKTCFCVLLSHKFFFHPLLITSCFCSSRFAFTSFFISFSVWPFIVLIPFFLNSVSLPSLSSVFQQQFPSCTKNSSIYLFLHACVPSLCPFADTFVHLLSLFLSLRFLVSNTCVSLFLLLFSLSITFLKDKFMELLQIWKNVCLFPFPFLLGTCFIFICLCMFVFVSKFPVFDLFSCFWTFFCFVLILERFSLCRSLFYVPLFFLFEDSVWFHHRFSHFFTFSCYIFSFFHTKPCFLNCFRLCCLFFFLKKNWLCFLFVGRSKVRIVPLCFLFLLVFLLLKKKNLHFSAVLPSFLNASLFFSKTKTLSEKLCVHVYRSLFSFSFICFSCRFVFDFSWSPSQHVSF